MYGLEPSASAVLLRTRPIAAILVVLALAAAIFGGRAAANSPADRTGAGAARPAAGGRFVAAV